MSDFCINLGISVECVFSENKKPTLNYVSCGAVIEIFNYRKFKGFDPQKITKAIGLITKNPEINHKACLAKIYKTLKTDKSKREKLKEELRNAFLPYRFPQQHPHVQLLHLNLTNQMSFQNKLLRNIHKQGEIWLKKNQTIKKEIGKKG